MAINQDTLKTALGKDYDPQGDYIVCGYDQLEYCLGRGYRQVGTIQDPSPADQDLLVFDRRVSAKGTK